MRSLLDIIENSKDILLSYRQIENLLQDDCQLVLYSNFKHMYHNNIPFMSLFKNSNNIILLYELSDASGASFNHWVSIINQPQNGSIVFYDSYGLDIDEQLKLDDSNQDKPYLTMLLKKVPKFITFDINLEQKQKFVEDMNTCGRHAAVRCNFDEMNNTEYNGMLDGAAKKYKMNHDTLVTMLTILVKEGVR